MILLLLFWFSFWKILGPYFVLIVLKFQNNLAWRRTLFINCFQFSVSFNYKLVCFNSPELCFSSQFYHSVFWGFYYLNVGPILFSTSLFYIFLSFCSTFGTHCSTWLSFSSFLVPFKFLLFFKIILNYSKIHVI